MMRKKLILPAEVKTCATCSYWDGERAVDTELRLVVVDDEREGECLVQGRSSQALVERQRAGDTCAWEHLAPDVAPDEQADSV